MSEARRVVFITGAGGYLGTALIRRLAQDSNAYRIIAFDVREIAPDKRHPDVKYVKGDVRDLPLLRSLLMSEKVDTLAHLASIVNPGGPAHREFERSVDVGGTENVLAASAEAGVRQLIVTSSGAAYGYHADNPIPLRETDPLRGNPEFAYADHKRLIEERLEEYRTIRPELRQLVLRPGTILGEGTDNQITRLFRGRLILGVAGFDTPFVFIWDEDVVEIIRQGIERRMEGIFNLAGDGAVTLREIARMAGKPYLPIPSKLFQAALWILQKLGRIPSGPEQIIFLQYRPVLANDKLKRDFGYQPCKTSREAFAFYWDRRRNKANA